MKDLILTRFYLPKCTLGVMTGDDGLDIKIMERPWKQNKPFESCVPEGTYTVIRDERPSHKYTFCLINEDLDVYRYPSSGKRDSILIHVGNKVEDVVGCLAPGVMFGTKAPAAGYNADGENVVLRSADGFRKLNGYIGGDQEFQLTIRQYVPEMWR